MKHRTIIGTLAGVVAATTIAGGAVALAGGSGDQEGGATGPDADQAVAAALAETGATKSNAVERDSENGAAWEVEVTKPDGAAVDVRLDGNYHVIVVEPDSEAASDTGK
jgi:hypothetical protein